MYRCGADDIHLEPGWRSNRPDQPDDVGGDTLTRKDVLIGKVKARPPADKYAQFPRLSLELPTVLSCAGCRHVRTKADDTMSLFTHFDHYDLPLGPDGTPYDYFERLRDEAVETDTAIGWSEAYGGLWVVAAWEAAQEVHHNTEAFSNSACTFPKYGTPGDRPFMLSEMDDPMHKKYRRLVTTPFSPKSAEARDGQIRAIANNLIDGIVDSGRADACDATEYLPERVIAVILGLSLDDAPKYRRWVHAIVSGATDPAGSAADLQEMAEYCLQSVEQRRRNPSDDLLTAIVQSEADGEKLNDTELVDFFTVLLLGGIDNTARFLSNVFWRLAWDKDLRRRLARDPGLVPFAVEEFLRMHGPAMVFRLVTERVTVADVTMEPGQYLGLAHPIYNRDPRQFDNPDSFIPERSPNRHFALGRGVHRCLGLHLVKVEVRIMIEEFLKRIPEFELDPAAKPVWKSGQVGAMIKVPIVFPAGGGQPGPDWTPARSLELQGAQA